MPSAAFFGALAAYQLTWAAILLLQPVRPAYLWPGAGVNAVAVAVWLQSRTAGVPFGPHKGEPGPFARTDVLAGMLQVSVVAAALAMLLRPRTGSRPGVPRPRLAIATTTASVAVISAFALSGAAGHAHPPSDEHGPGMHTQVLPAVSSPPAGADPSAPAARKAQPAGAKKPTSRKAGAPQPTLPPAPAAHDDGDGHAH